VTVPFTRRDLRGLKQPTSLWTQTTANNGSQIPQTYLGHAIDMESNAGKCDKAYRALWTFRDTYGKTWGLKT
jgi:hypothetical protein